MAEVRNKKRGPGRSSTWLFAGALVLVAVLGVGTLHALGVIRVPGLPGSARAGEDREGKVPVWVAARKIDAFEKVSDGDLFDPKGQPSLRWIEEADAKDKKFLISRTDIIGRVLKNDKSAGIAFKETDFYPKGTPPTPSAAIEQGFVGMWVNPKGIDGLDRLTRGERFQILGVIDTKSAAKVSAPDPAAADAQAARNAFGAQMDLVVNHGRVIVGLNPASSSKDMFLELMPEDVERLASAQKKNASLRCITLSTTAGPDQLERMQPKDRADTETIRVLDGKGGRETAVVKTPEEQPK